MSEVKIIMNKDDLQPLANAIKNLKNIPSTTKITLEQMTNELNSLSPENINLNIFLDDNKYYATLGGFIYTVYENGELVFKEEYYPSTPISISAAKNSYLIFFAEGAFGLSTESAATDLEGNALPAISTIKIPGVGYYYIVPIVKDINNIRIVFSNY